MAFQIKDFVSIVLSMVNHARSVTDKVTDFQPGSVVRTIMEAPAVELEELYLQMFLGLREAIPVATFTSFGFDKLAAKVAHGYVSISVLEPLAQDLVVPMGTDFKSADGRHYVSTELVTWPAGVTIIRIPVAHTKAGAAGNISVGLINASSFFNEDEYIISNALIDSGANEENDLEREARFTDFIKSLSRGTVTACLYAAKVATILDADNNVAQYVTRSGIFEDPGYVRIYLYANTGKPSQALLAAAQAALDGHRDDVSGTITPGYRSAGVQVQVFAMQERSIDLGVQVAMFDGYALTPAVEQKIGDLFGGVIRTIAPGATLHLGSLVESLLDVDGVEKIIPLTNSNILCGMDEVLIPGTLSVSAL